MSKGTSSSACDTRDSPMKFTLPLSEVHIAPIRELADSLQIPLDVPKIPRFHDPTLLRFQASKVPGFQGPSFQMSWAPRFDCFPQTPQEAVYKNTVNTVNTVNTKNGKYGKYGKYKKREKHTQTELIVFLFSCFLCIFCFLLFFCVCWGCICCFFVSPFVVILSVVTK